MNPIVWQVLPDRSRSIRSLLWVSLACSTLCGGEFVGLSAKAAERGSAWRTGASFHRQAQVPVTVTFSGTRLRTTLRRLSEVHRVASFLDRRVDPSLPVRFTANQLPLQEIYAQLAAQHACQTSRLQSVLYVGPADSAESLQTTAALARKQIDRLPEETRKQFAQVHSWHSLALTTPRSMLAWLAKEAGVTVENLDDLPHDLWPEIDLPPLAWSDRVTLLLIGFDKTFELDRQGRQLKIVPLDKSKRLTVRYPGGQRPQQRAELVTQRISAAKVSVEGRQLVVTGTAEQQRAVSQLLSGNLPRETPPKSNSPPAARQSAGGKQPQAKQVYTLRIANQPLAPVLQSLAKQLRMPLELDTKAAQLANIDLNQLVSCEVKEVSLQELLDAILNNTGLSATTNQGKIMVNIRK